MRLGQLSRKVNVKPNEILNYLKLEFDVELGSHLNTKVDDALVEKVVAKFHSIPEPSESKEDSTPISDPVESAEINETIEPEVSNLEEEPSEDSVSDEETESSESEPSVEFELHQEVDASTIANAPLIKAEKVELTGPKVVGKIELPPPLSEQMVEVDGVMISKEELANRKKEKRREQRELKQKQREKRSASSARKSRIKSEAQLEQLKKDKAAEEMAKKLEYREKRIAAQQKEKSKPDAQKFVPKKTKKKNNYKIEKAENITPTKPEPTTWYGKLWKWFNT